MTTLKPVSSYRIRMDGKRRPTLPVALLDDAGIDPAHELVAHADAHGRVVLEDPLVMLSAFQSAVAQDKKATGNADSLVDQLLMERATDASTRS